MKISRTKNTNLFLPVISASSSALVALYNQLGAFIIFTLLPLFISLSQKSTFKDYFKKVVAFSVLYYGILFSFLYTIKDFMPFNSLLNIIIAVVVIIIVTLWQSVWLCGCLLLGYYFKGVFSRPFAVTLLFVLAEHLQENNPFFTFAFTKLENSLAFFPQLIQPAYLFGGSFVAFLILTVSSFISIFANKKATAFSRYISVFLALLTILTVISFSNLRINSYTPTGKPLNAVIIQTSIEGKEKYNLTVKDAVDNCAHILTYGVNKDTDLVLLPETSIPEYLNKEKAFLTLYELAQKNNTVIVTGCFSQENNQDYNSLVAINPDNTLSKTYNKTFLIPFGEYAPFLKDFFKFRNLSCAKENSPLKTKNGVFTCAVCIESVLSDITSKQSADGGELILISTNDSWFGNSRGRNLHFANSVLRAVECDRYLLRSGNCGISAFISPTGIIKAADFSKKESTISQTVYKNPYPSVYSLVGDIIIIPSVFIMITGIYRAFLPFVKKFFKKGIFRKIR